MMPWMTLAVASLIVILGIMMAIISYKNKGKTKRGPDYYTFFLMGLIWLPIGIFQLITGGSSIFFILSLLFLGIGFSHKKDWKKNHVSFSKFSGNKKKIALAVIMGLSVFVLLGILIFFLNF